MCGANGEALQNLFAGLRAALWQEIEGRVRWCAVRQKNRVQNASTDMTSVHLMPMSESV